MLWMAATGNSGKLREIRAYLEPFGIRVEAMPEGMTMPEETAWSYLENARAKARHVFERTGVPTIADDSGLEVRALHWLPGVRSARFAGDGASDAQNNGLLLERLQGVDDRAARFRCVLVLAEASGERVAAATVDGEILHAPRGEGGFGYDPLFLVPDLGRSKAELTVGEKLLVSHRGRALRRLASVCL